MIPDSTPILQVIGVSYAYPGRHPALTAVDLAVERGAQLAILGANGCGKSTLLKILNGLIRPDAGRVEAFGEDVTAVTDDAGQSRWLHRRIGLVFQDADVQLFSPTVWDDVAFGPLQMGWPSDQVRHQVEATMALMEITDLARRAPYELSEGEKKRVAIASVLSLEPEVLLLDEPTASLDPRSKSVLLDLIARLGEEGRTIVTTTQELDIVPAIANQAVVFGDHEHRPVASGSVESILEDDDLLVRANLIHEHLHYHGRRAHVHRHGATHHG